MTGLLELERVTVSYNGLRAVSDVSLVVPEGCVVALIGANGAGKTTILRTISGLIRPESGTVTFAGRRIDGRPAHAIARRGALHVPEGRGIFPSLSVQQNLDMARATAEVGVDLTARAVELFPALGSRLEQVAGTMSGGEQQMLAMARALVARPRLLMLDEISMGLAPIIVRQLFDAVRAMKDTGATVLLVEQYVEAALELADYVYVLDKGRVAHVGEPSDVREAGLATSYLGG
ncbi:MAG TPA: ABC transporter ATP-binding protein [Acidimicrobiales bacterium]|nr:ABC transporter ATP-binding protein [Acidimicrobiales bacterium]